MARLVLLAGIVLGCTGSVQGDPVVARGDEMNIWLEGAVGPSFQVRFGYQDLEGEYWADPATIIGDDVWFTQPGSYDLSGDPQLLGFLSYAINGIADPARLQIWDHYDLRLHIPMTEDIWLGQFPDLAPLAITGAKLHVEEVTPQANGVQLIIQMEYLGVPEPASLVLAAAMVCIAGMTKQVQWGQGAFRC